MTKQAEQIVNVLAGMTEAKDQITPQALPHARAIENEIVSQLEAHDLTAQAWQAFQRSPQAAAALLTNAVQFLLAADATLTQRMDALLDQYQQATGKSTTVNTGGGAYVGGNVDVRHGDFVGRDKHTTTITGDGNIIGDHSSSTVIKQQSTDKEAVARTFAAFYTAVQQKPDLPPEDKEDLQAELEEVETELKKGTEAHQGFIRRRLRNIERIAPDIYDVVITTFGNPLAGLGMVAKKIAKKMKAEAG